MFLGWISFFSVDCQPLLWFYFTFPSIFSTRVKTFSLQARKPKGREPLGRWKALKMTCSLCIVWDKLILMPFFGFLLYISHLLGATNEADTHNTSHSSHFKGKHVDARTLLTKLDFCAEELVFVTSDRGLKKLQL